MKPHRWVYEQYVGKIGDGLTIDHLCRVKHCVNPDHLEVVTNAENIRRRPPTLKHRNAVKTHCPNGHPYDVFRYTAEGRLKRRCSTCDRDRERKRGRRRRNPSVGAGA